MAEQKKNFPITRTRKFFQGADFDLEIRIGREYMTDLNMTVLLFQVDYKKTKVHDLYGESKAHEKIVKSPIELQVRLEIEDSETKYLAQDGLRREFAGDLIFTVYEKELEEKGVLNMKEGDYIGYVDGTEKLRYWEIYNAEQINIANKRTIAGFKSSYRLIKCSIVDSDVFKG